MAGSPIPSSLDEIRRQVSSPRWRVYEAICGVLGEIDGTLDWERLYDADAPLHDFLSWGLYLEKLIPVAGERIRAALAPPASGEERPDPHPEELEDAVFWGAKQIESGMQQVVSILSRHMVGLIAAGEGESKDIDVVKNQALCVPVADVAGKLRADLRRFAAFIVAGEQWNPSQLELTLFPQKMEELQKGQRLKRCLVHTMESFQGTDDRIAIGDVIRLWRTGRVLGPAALYEIDLLLSGLLDVLQRENRRALYADSYFRLSRWIGQVRRCIDGLKQNLGNDEVEDSLLKEIAAVLDSEMLAEMLGWDLVREAASERRWADIGREVHESEVKKLDFERSRRKRLLEIKSRLDDDAAGAELDDADADVLVTAASALRGKRLVDQLRIRSKLPAAMRHLENLQPLVIDSEDGLKTYLMLLYGQIQNRDLHLLEVDQKNVPIAEKRLAVLELEYQLARLGSSERYQAFEAARAHVAGGETIPDETWEGLQAFLQYLVRELAPRLRRIASFAEIEGIPPDCAADLETGCQPLLEMDEPPAGEQVALLEGLLEAMLATLVALRDISIVVAPPQTEAEIEDFLRTMG